MNRNQMMFFLFIAMISACIGGLISYGIFHGSTLGAQQALSFTTNEFSLPPGHYIGIVESGKLHLIFPKPALDLPVRLTSIQMHEARSTEIGEIDLKPFEGKSIMFKGQSGGSWIYQASIVDRGGPLMTALVKKVFQ